MWDDGDSVTIQWPDFFCRKNSAPIITSYPNLPSAKSINIWDWIDLGLDEKS